MMIIFLFVSIALATFALIFAVAQRRAYLQPIKPTGNSAPAAGNSADTATANQADGINSAPPPRGMLVLGVALLLFTLGAVLIFIEGERLNRAAAIKLWPQTEGTVIRTDIRGQRGFTPQVTYRYRVGGRAFTDSFAVYAPAFGTGRLSRRATAEQAAQPFAPQTPVAVYYNPQDPADSRLQTGEGWDVYIRLAVGLMLYIGALVAALYFFFAPVRNAVAP